MTKTTPFTLLRVSNTLCLEALSRLGPEVNILGADGELTEVDLEGLSPLKRAEQILLAYEESESPPECARCDGRGCPACPPHLQPTNEDPY